MTVTTTTIWPLVLNNTPEQVQATKDAREAAAVAIAGEEYREELERSFDAISRTLIVRRTWPDQTTAEAWISYVLSEGAQSSVIDPV